MYDKPVIQLDLLPTALAAAGVPAEPGRGRSTGSTCSLHLDGRDPTRRPTTPSSGGSARQAAIRRGDWKLVRYDTGNLDIPGRPVGRPVDPPVGPFRLYNLADDVGEVRDRSGDRPDKAKELQAAWEAWSREMAPPLWGPAGLAAGPSERTIR